MQRPSPLNNSNNYSYDNPLTNNKYGGVNVVREAGRFESQRMLLDRYNKISDVTDH